MEVVIEEFDELSLNPVDQFETFTAGNDWPSIRVSDDEMGLSISGSWCDYHLTVSWQPIVETVQIACALEIEVPDERFSELRELICRINEHLGFGHFDLWSEDRAVVFRVAMPLHGIGEIMPEQCDMLLRTAIEACERNYPAFQFLLWEDKSVTEALAASMFETAGTA